MIAEQPLSVAKLLVVTNYPSRDCGCGRLKWRIKMKLNTTTMTSLIGAGLIPVRAASAETSLNAGSGVGETSSALLGV